MKNSKGQGRYDVSVIGPAVIDVLVAPFCLEAFSRNIRDVDQIRMSYGGDALNESVVLERLGKNVQLISKVGKDEAGGQILQYLKNNHVCTDHVIVQDGLDTAINIALIEADGRRRFLMNPNSSLRKLGPADVLPLIDEMAEIVCFASLFISPLFTIQEMEELFSQIKKSGRRLVVDTTRPKNGETFDDIRCLLPYMDVIVPNDEEISLLTGIEDAGNNVNLLMEAGVVTPVVKIGSRGSLVGTREGIIHVPAVPGIKCIDTTGAGDTFAAGFIAGLCAGWNIEECARLGCAAASCSVEKVGATDGVRSMEQVMERLQRVP